MQNSKIEQFKSQKIFDIKKRTYAYGVLTINFIRDLPNDMASSIIARQLLRAATSIGANVAEGQSASSKKEFINFHNHALKSANETKFWLGMIKDSKVYSDYKVDVLLEEAKEIASILAAIIISSRNKRYKTF
ncbi:MAG: four helix bundle protein [Candidatus Omnitrophica bacterium]|nr:four helix bundle protein [Candidatus Omnitrophota bacterium]